MGVHEPNFWLATEFRSPGRDVFVLHMEIPLTDDQGTQMRKWLGGTDWAQARQLLANEVAKHGLYDPEKAARVPLALGMVAFVRATGEEWPGVEEVQRFLHTKLGEDPESSA